MFTTKERFDIQAKAMESLRRLRENKAVNEQSSKVKDRKFDYSTLVFEEFTDESFVDKMKGDSTFYNILINKLDAQYEENLHFVVNQLFEKVKTIYEHLNIKPRIYNLSIENILTESEDVLSSKVTRIINDFVNRRYYNLNQEQREAKYYDRVKRLSMELMETDNVEVSQAIEFATKVMVIKDLVETVSFPGIIKDKVYESLVSEEYAEFFDQEALVEDWKKFNETSELFAKLVGTII
jgi:hypothetical protein